MFINSKKNFNIRLADDSVYKIPKDYIGEIPNEVAKQWIVKAAIKDGSIATPVGKKDDELEAADEVADENAEQYDIRIGEENGEENPGNEDSGKTEKPPAKKGK